MENCEEFIKGFNLDSPWDNPDIKNVMDNIMAIFADEATKLYDKNDETFLNQSIKNNSDIISHLNTNHTRYTLQHVFVPVDYISKFSKMLTDRAVDDSFSPQVYEFVGYDQTNPGSNYENNKRKVEILLDARIKFGNIQYQEYLKNILCNSLTINFSSTKTKRYEEFEHIVFRNKCRAFYHVILGYINMLQYILKDVVNNVSMNYAPQFPTIFKKHEVNGDLYFYNFRHLDRINKYKEYMNKFACDVVVLGYIVEKLRV